jgi:hypothetical protein
MFPAMTLAVGLVLCLLGIAAALLQARWAARTGSGSVSLWCPSRALPTGQRWASDLAVAGLWVGGAIVLELGRPEWVFYVAVVAVAAVGTAAQALTVRALRGPVAH